MYQGDNHDEPMFSNDPFAIKDAPWASLAKMVAATQMRTNETSAFSVSELVMRGIAGSPSAKLFRH